VVFVEIFKVGQACDSFPFLVCHWNGHSSIPTALCYNSLLIYAALLTIIIVSIHTHLSSLIISALTLVAVACTIGISSI
jgi:hypothetical protein